MSSAGDPTAPRSTSRTAAPDARRLLWVDAAPEPFLEAILEAVAAEADRAGDLEGVARLLDRGGYDVALVDIASLAPSSAAGIAQLAALAPELPILALAPDHDEAVAVASLQQGAQECLVRGDFDARGLDRTIRHATERHRILRELDAALEREQYLATHDPLTALPNRMLFYDRVAQAIALASRYDSTLALLFVDLDGFKPVNDRLGHAVGDRVLQQVARRLEAAVRRSDTVARIGGDEFAVLLTQIAEPHNAEKVAESILASIGRPFDLEGEAHRLGASIGIAIFPRDGGTADTLVRHADTAMYQAKKRGGHAVVFFDPAFSA